eukprot:12924914-Prorocentrum_lima.AAC.1
MQQSVQATALTTGPSAVAILFTPVKPDWQYQEHVMPTLVHAPQVYRPVELAAQAATWPSNSPPANTHLSHN